MSNPFSTGASRSNNPFGSAAAGQASNPFGSAAASNPFGNRPPPARAQEAPVLGRSYTTAPVSTGYAGDLMQSVARPHNVACVDRPLPYSPVAESKGRAKAAAD